VNLLLVLTELFSLGVTAEALQAITGSKLPILLQRGSIDPQFLVEGFAPTNHSFSEKTKINGLSYGVKISTVFFRFVAIHAFVGRMDRRTDGRTDIILIARPRLVKIRPVKSQKTIDLL